jgi:hypothetical protein
MKTPTMKMVRIKTPTMRHHLMMMLSYEMLIQLTHLTNQCVGQVV